LPELYSPSTKQGSLRFNDVLVHDNHCLTALRTARGPRNASRAIETASAIAS
jgi:hypothetical protein